MKKEQVIEELRQEMLKHAERAEWFKLHREFRLASFERLKHRAFWDILNALEEKTDKQSALETFNAILYDYDMRVEGLLHKGLIALAENAEMQSEVCSYAIYIVSCRWD